MPLGIPLHHRRFRSSLEPLFRRLPKTQPRASAWIAFVFGIAWGEDVEGNHRDLTLNRPSFWQERTYGTAFAFSSEVSASLKRGMEMREAMQMEERLWKS